MSSVYILEEDGKTSEMARIKCKDEEKDLQQLLEKNHNLLPGKQIRPEEPRRWLLIKREMPVQDPETGGDRWSLDFFFVDQSGMPTFVECKRFENTQSRREVVGQMLEYAANGQYYWTKEMIRDFAVKTAKEENVELEDAVRFLEPEGIDSVDDFLELIMNNLEAGQIRLIFFLDEAPQELKSIVDFLNRQMERSEVLIVEAKQYEGNGLQVVAPSLFGYSEEARRVKKTTIITPAERRKWNESDFFEEANKNLKEDYVRAIRDIYDYCKSSGCEIRWGTGIQTGSFNVVLPNFYPKSIISLCSNGRLYLGFGALFGNELLEDLQNYFASEIIKIGLSLPSELKDKYPGFSSDDWVPKKDDLITILKDLLSKYSNHPK